MDNQAVLGLEQDVIFPISCQRFGQVHTDDLKLTVIRFAEDLGITQQCIWSCTSRQIHGVTKVSGAIGDVVAGISDFSCNGDGWRVFKIVSPENSHCVEWF